MFDTDSERREAWEGYRDELMSEYLSGPGIPGLRPDAWWAYVAQRPQHLSDYPLDFEGSDEDHADALDEYAIEPIVFLAAHGHLTDAEMAKIAAAATVARPRIGTPAEQIGSGGVDRVDRRAVKLHEAVQEALREKAT